MTVEAGAFDPNREVDEIRWLSPDDAGALLTYERDLPVLESVASGLGGELVRGEP